jgi:hypothetical protein
MPEMGTSGLMSGDGKRGGAQASALASILDSTTTPRKTARGPKGRGVGADSSWGF